MKKLFLWFALLLAAGILSAAEFARIHNFSIILPEAPSEIEKSAAGELKEHLSRSFTAPAVLNGKTPGRINMFIGLSKAAQQAGFNGDYSESRKESKFGIYRHDNDFLFTGFDTPGGSIYAFRESCGTLLAVEYFAQKYLQSKFFMPGKDGTRYAVNPAVNFTAASDIPNASYDVRGFQSSAKDIAPQDFMLFFRRKLGQVPAWSGHNYYYTFLNKWNKRFKHKPEMFGLYGNKRINAKYPRHFPCPSHPDVVPQIISDINEAISKNPRISAIRFFSDAPVAACKCSACVNSPVGKLVSSADRSEFVFAFFCKFANEIKKKHPQVIFHLRTKSSHFQPPRTEKLPEGTVVEILSGHFNAPDYDVLRNRCRQWKKAGARVLLYSYPRAPEMKTYPIINPHRIADHLKIMNGYAAGAVMSEGKAKIPYTFSALNTYVHSAIMFDCTLDTDTLIAEFCQLAAPGAAAELQDFYRAMEGLLENASFRDQPLTNCYLTFRLKEPRKLLDKALAKTPGNAFLQALSQDFAVFEELARKAAPAFITAEKYEKLQKLFTLRQEPFKLSAAGELLEFKPFAIYCDFQKSSVRVSGKDNMLHLQFVCAENRMNRLRVASKENHTGNVWGDDAVEIFIAPAEKTTPRMHLAVNAAGIYRTIATDNRDNSDDDRNFAVTTRAVREKGRWILDVTIPINEVKKFADQNKFSLGIYRHRPARNRDKAQFSGLQKPLTGDFSSISGRFVVEF